MRCLKNICKVRHTIKIVPTWLREWFVEYQNLYLLRRMMGAHFNSIFFKAASSFCSHMYWFSVECSAVYSSLQYTVYACQYIQFVVQSPLYWCPVCCTFKWWNSLCPDLCYWHWTALDLWQEWDRNNVQCVVCTPQFVECKNYEVCSCKCGVFVLSFAVWNVQNVVSSVHCI